jgi:uncharacterized Rmd1/YagE family protein
MSTATAEVAKVSGCCHVYYALDIGFSVDLNHFDQRIKNELSLLNMLYTTLSDEADHERSVRLEWIVIVLIFIEIVMGLADKILPLLHRA